MYSLNSTLILLLWIILIVSLAIISKVYFPIKRELSRKIVHIGTGPIVPLAWLLGVEKGIAVTFSLLITLMLIVNHRVKIIGSIEDVNRRSYGTIAYGLSITILLWIFWPNNPSAVTAGVLIMAFGDGIAGLIGPEIKSPSWTILGQKKSIAGTTSMLLISIFILFILSTISGVSLHPLLIILLAFFGTALEQFSPLGVDNLTVPLGVAFGWLFASNL